MQRTNLIAWLVLAAVLTGEASAQQETGQEMNGGVMGNQAAAVSNAAQIMACMDTTDLSSVLHRFGCPICFLGAAVSSNLTQQEILLLEALGSKCLKNEREYQAKAEAMRSELMLVLGKEPVEWEKAKQIISEFCKLKKTALIDQLDCLRDAKNTLTPEQLKKIMSTSGEDMHQHMVGKSMMDSSSTAH